MPSMLRVIQQRCAFHKPLISKHIYSYALPQSELLGDGAITPLSSDTSAMDQLQDFLRQRRASPKPVKNLEAFEQELHRLFVAAEREALSHEVGRFDLDVPTIETEGARYHRVLRCATTYNSAAGPIRVERSLYRQKHDSGRAVCPLELRAGILAGYWTPLAAKQATGVVAHLTPQEGEELFALLGNMTPSKSTLDRLPK